MENHNTNPEMVQLEDKLFNDGVQLLSNGHRMTYVFKYIREHANDDEMRTRVMERITANNHVQEINESRLEQATTSSKVPSSKIIIGFVIIVLALLLMKYLFQMGWISTLPLIIIFAVFAAWGSRRG